MHNLQLVTCKGGVLMIINNLRFPLFATCLVNEMLNLAGYNVTGHALATELFRIVVSFIFLFNAFLLKFVHHSLLHKIRNVELLLALCLIYIVALTASLVDKKVTAKYGQQIFAGVSIYGFAATLIELLTGWIFNYIKDRKDDEVGNHQGRGNRFQFRILHRRYWMLNGREEWILRFEELKNGLIGRIVERRDRNIVEGDGDENARRM